MNVCGMSKLEFLGKSGSYMKNQCWVGVEKGIYRKIVVIFLIIKDILIDFKGFFFVST